VTRVPDADSSAHRIVSSQTVAEIGCRLKHGGGLMPVIGWARFAAAVLFLFIIPTTPAFHAFWSVDPERHRTK
jgi:uncharacterized membrane protein YphA (DoxX/SURF4 family)